MICVDFSRLLGGFPVAREWGGGGRFFSCLGPRLGRARRWRRPLRHARRCRAESGRWQPRRRRVGRKGRRGGGLPSRPTYASGRCAFALYSGRRKGMGVYVVARRSMSGKLETCKIRVAFVALLREWELQPRGSPTHVFDGLCRGGIRYTGRRSPMFRGVRRR